MRLPGGAVTPAMKPTTGFFMLSLIHSAALASSGPPISPIMMTASVSGSSLNIFMMSMCFRPLIGSPPMPTADDWPRPKAVSWPTASGQRARTRHHADTTLLVDVAWHDADLDFVRGDQAWAVRTQQQGFGTRLGHAVFQGHHVAHRNAFGDANGQVHLGFDGFPDCGGGAGWRHVDDRHVGAGFFFRFGDVGENWNAFEVFAGFLRIDASDESGFAVRVIAAHAGVELAGLAGDPLGNDFGIFIDQNGHVDSLIKRDRQRRRRRSWLHLPWYRQR